MTATRTLCYRMVQRAERVERLRMCMDASARYVLDCLEAWERGDGPDVPVGTMRLAAVAVFNPSLFFSAAVVARWSTRHSREVLRSVGVPS